MELTRQLQAIKKRKEENSLRTQNKVHTKFRYTGNKPWIFKGAHTQIRYRFKYKDHTLIIEPQDVPAAMGEPFLESIS